MKAAYLLLIVTLYMDDCMGSSIIYTQHDSFADLCFITYDIFRSDRISSVYNMSVRLEECKICLKSVRMEECKIERV